MMHTIAEETISKSFPALQASSGGAGSPLQQPQHEVRRGLNLVQPFSLKEGTVPQQTQFPTSLLPLSGQKKQMPLRLVSSQLPVSAQQYQDLSDRDAQTYLNNPIDLESPRGLTALVEESKETDGSQLEDLKKQAFQFQKLNNNSLITYLCLRQINKQNSGLMGVNKSPRSNKSTINSISQQASSSTRSKNTKSGLLSDQLGKTSQSGSNQRKSGRRKSKAEEAILGGGGAGCCTCHCHAQTHHSRSTAKAESQATNEEDEEQKLEMKDTYFRRQGSCVMHPATNQKSGSLATTSNNDVDSASHDSRQRLSTNTEGASLITSAKMQGDVGSSMQIGLNIFEEITVKYNKELKQQLKKSILTSKSSMSFEDIAGNEYAKEIINETFILPTIMPKVFKASWSRKNDACSSGLLPLKSHLLLGITS
ncbi:hypothetical protein FGO68_gene1327 [Halteria grandinella]|uniref:Uncharacterized protein n=1 Tax=Halteria grandinella TaxID=5974 RepID=A0A8J8T7U3_HALGN|nr:hypothetical protein FGO68_gene1327 [Halteria grandinella]